MLNVSNDICNRLTSRQTTLFTVMVHATKIVKSTMTLEEASSFIISVGVDFAKLEDVAAKLIQQQAK